MIHICKAERAGPITSDQKCDVGHPHTEGDGCDKFVLVPYGDAGSLSERHFGREVVTEALEWTYMRSTISNEAAMNAM